MEMEGVHRRIIGVGRSPPHDRVGHGIGACFTLFVAVQLAAEPLGLNVHSTTSPLLLPALLVVGTPPNVITCSIAPSNASPTSVSGEWKGYMFEAYHHHHYSSSRSVLRFQEIVKQGPCVRRGARMSIEIASG